MGGYIFVSCLLVTIIPFASFSPTPQDHLTMNLNLNESPRGEFVGQHHNGGHSDYEEDYADSSDTQFGCNGDAHGISCCSMGFTTGDNYDGKEVFIQSNDYTEQSCFETCKKLHPTSVGLTESVHQKYSSGNGTNKNKCWCEFGDVRLNDANINYQTCVFETVKCGPASAKERIIGGTEVEPNEYPWMTSITFLHNYRDHCGGALINKDWVLTAAHCMIITLLNGHIVGVRDPKQIFITLGEHDRTKDTTNIFKTTASRFFINPYYRTFEDSKIEDSGNWDLTLLRLKEPVYFKAFPNIRPICLPEKDLEAKDFKRSDHKKYWDEPVRIMGWGLTEKTYRSETGSAILRDAKLKVYNTTYCERLFQNYNRPKTPFLICAGAEVHNDETGSKDSCANDSGGPLVHLHVPEDPFGRMRWEVIGVTSYGEGPLNGCGRVGAYTRVSMHLGWIDGIMNDYKKSN